ncbi:unnamed protein product [Parnassius mnemosyne]|uniref:FLYWCH-type domain-containing protein n=1 Tax=Parnassius mnemosyne TaxID=213953 RepID=A0AAV1KAN4_9NEOP
MGCKARIKLHDDGSILNSLLTHDHDPPKVHVTSSDSTEFIPSNRHSGRGMGTILVYRGFTFSRMKTNTRWYCSKTAFGCKMRLRTTPEGQVIESQNEHNHDPPNLFRCVDGKLHRC